MEVGAGTMAPETFLRVLGPEPWRVAYVQPAAVPPMAVMVKTPTGCTSTSNFRSFSSRPRTMFSICI